MPSRRRRTVLLAAVLGAALGCAPKVQVPPKVALAEWQVIGIVDFQQGETPELGRLATREFIAMLQAAQPGARILELGPEARVLAEVDKNALDFRAVRALGEIYEVDAVFAGALELGEATPRVTFGETLASIRARADVDGQLSTRLLETSSGAVVWSRSARASASVAHLGLPEHGLPTFGASDPETVESGLVRSLVSNLRYDFYPTWRRP